jgi:F-type H+-transporting ATPase subunit b
VLIDWYTVGAQALNFVILVWLMKHFLYGPILNAIDAREKRIAKEIADADAKKAEAQKEHEEFQHKNEEFDQQRATLLSKATDEAKGERQRLLAEARQAAEALTAKRQETLRNDAHNLNQAISRRTQQEVFAIARKALTDLASTSLEERLGEVFTRRLRTMDSQAKAGLGQALKTTSAPALVRSAFDLPAEQRAAIQNALNETFSTEIRLRFEIAPDLVSGIELTAGGQKVEWSISDYLGSLERDVGELLKENDRPKAKAKAEPKPEAKAEPKPEAKAESKPEPKPEAKAEPKPEAKAEPKPEPKPEAKAEPKPEAKPEPKPEAKAEPKPEPKPEAKAEPKPEAKAEPKPEAKAEPKPEAKAEPKPEAKAEAKAEPKPEAKAEPKPEAKAESKSEEPKPETKSP